MSTSNNTEQFILSDAHVPEPTPEVIFNKLQLGIRDNELINGKKLSNEKELRNMLAIRETRIDLDKYYEQKCKTKILQVEFLNLLRQMIGLLEIEQCKENIHSVDMARISNMIIRLKSLIGDSYDFEVLEEAADLYKEFRDDPESNNIISQKRYELDMVTCERIKQLSNSL